MGKMNEMQRKLLEQMMGPEAMGVQVVNLDWWNEKRMDLGPCPKTHSDRILKQFQDAQAANPGDPRIGAFRQEHENSLYGFVEECDRRIRASQRKLEKTPEENRKTVDLMREIGEIELSIQGGTEEIEALGEAGKVEESMEKLQAVDALKGLKAEKERDLTTLNETAGASGHQKLRVCETCGAMLSVLDSDKRLADHFGGKMHLGYHELRQLLAKFAEARMAARNGPPPGPPMNAPAAPRPNPPPSAPSGPSHSAPIALSAPPASIAPSGPRGGSSPLTPAPRTPLTHPKVPPPEEMPAVGHGDKVKREAGELVEDVKEVKERGRDGDRDRERERDRDRYRERDGSREKDRDRDRDRDRYKERDDRDRYDKHEKYDRERRDERPSTRYDDRDRRDRDRDRDRKYDHNSTCVVDVQLSKVTVSSTQAFTQRHYIRDSPVMSGDAIELVPTPYHMVQPKSYGTKGGTDTSALTSGGAESFHASSRRRDSIDLSDPALRGLLLVRLKPITNKSDIERNVGSCFCDCFTSAGATTWYHYESRIKGSVDPTEDEKTCIQISRQMIRLEPLFEKGMSDLCNEKEGSYWQLKGYHTTKAELTSRTEYLNHYASTVFHMITEKGGYSDCQLKICPTDDDFDDWFDRTQPLVPNTENKSGFVVS